jgi:hypothetical protein
MPPADRMTHHPDTRLPQRVALGVLLRSFPPVRVDQVLDAAGRREQRQRLLPARLMVYFTLGMWIFKSLPYELILTEILQDAPGLAPPIGLEEPASAAAIGRARRRLGVEPLRLLFDQAAGPSAAAGPAQRHGLRPVRLRQVEVGVPATPANLLGFASAARQAGPPLSAQLSLLIEDGTGRIVAAEVTDVDAAQPALERLLDGALPAESLLVMDERPVSARVWTAAERLGVELLWPLEEQAKSAYGSRLPDGSLLGKLPADDGSELVARVVYRTGDAAVGAAGPPARLATTILDHRAVPAADLVALFEQRRTAASAFDGLGAGGGADRLELRSKDPEMVRQEIYAMLCVQHAIGDLVGPAW